MPDGTAVVFNRDAVFSVSPMLVVLLLIAPVIFAGCSTQESGVSNASTYNPDDVALEFAKALASRDYSKAYAMTSREYQGQATIDMMKKSFEDIVPTDWGYIGPIEVGQTMTNWPNRESSDLARVYVSIGGDVYSEAVITIVALEGEAPKIREIGFGRP